MAGWNKRRVATFKRAFADFLSHVQITSKETGVSRIKLYYAQQYFLDEIFEGLERDVHHFCVLKARQLGISTITRALIVFWAFMHPGLRVALVYDTDKNAAEARAEIAQFLAFLPDSHSIDVKQHNSQFLELENGSRVSYMVAGIKKGKRSGGLGRSLGINCAGCTEVSSWADEEGMKAFQRSLAEKADSRLYIWESTARGFNIFYELWRDAKADDLNWKAIFIGWWAKEDYQFANDDPRFLRYGKAPPTKDEQQKIDAVKRLYGFEITQNQLAWYRHAFDPNIDRGDVERVGQEFVYQELPWYEDEAWIMSGSAFFPAEKLTLAMRYAMEQPRRGFVYHMGEHFETTAIEAISILRKATLHVWEEPDPNGVYVLGGDPAYSSSGRSDRYVAEVFRCYADGADQVAEFCCRNMATYQFAWVLAHLGGTYANARMLMELNGPGEAVLNAFRELEHLMRTGIYPTEADEEGLLARVFTNIRHYVAYREDVIKFNPSEFHWKTTADNKVQLLERFKDDFVMGRVTIKSPDLLAEMQKVVRDIPLTGKGPVSIKAGGSAKDDRVMAAALALQAWRVGERKSLLLQDRTRENEQKRKTLSHQDLHQMMFQRIIGNHFSETQRARALAQRQAFRGRRWSW